MGWTDEPAYDWDSYCREEQKRINKLPVCFCCDEHIQQETAVRIDGNWYCDECLDDMRRDVSYVG